MAQAEAARADGIEAVAIVTPNHMHAPVADAFLDAGIHIICDKPLTTTLEEARRLRDKARASGLIFAVTYNYSGLLVRHARAMVQGGELGVIRIVQVEYPQDWLADPLEAAGQKQADGVPIRRARVPAAASATSAPMPTSWRTLSPG